MNGSNIQYVLAACITVHSLRTTGFAMVIIVDTNTPSAFGTIVQTCFPACIIVYSGLSNLDRKRRFEALYHVPRGHSAWFLDIHDDFSNIVPMKQTMEAFAASLKVVCLRLHSTSAGQNFGRIDAGQIGFRRDINTTIDIYRELAKYETITSAGDVGYGCDERFLDSLLHPLLLSGNDEALVMNDGQWGHSQCDTYNVQQLCAKFVAIFGAQKLAELMS